jgi:predicted esterase
MRGDRQRRPGQQAAEEGRLLARSGQGRPPAAAQAALGEQRLGLDGQRDGLLYVPAAYDANRPAPLAVMLHGAGGSAQHGLALLRQFADAAGLLLLAPVSRRQTWDVLLGGYGPDISFMNLALAQTFDRYAVDPARLAIGGFSDGASYALSVGITNGDLFTHVIAFSPGFMAPASQHGAPRLFISHGTHDEVLPINRCSRRIVPQVQAAGYDVLYQEFDGPHTIPAEIARQGVDWFLGR